MSIGAPSNLGTTLVQRLDTMLGAVLGQEANIISGAGKQAVTQPGGPENPNATDPATQRPTQDAIEQSGTQGERRAASGRAVRAMQLDDLLGRSTTFRGLTQSAPTTLGYAARIILALLNEYPQAMRTIRGQAPLLPSAQASDALAKAAPPRPGPAGSPSASAGGPNAVWAQLASALDQPGALAARLAQALSQSIQQSGLFYESHLVRLAGGTLPAAMLRQEPQGKIPPQAPRQGTLDTAPESRSAPPGPQTLPARPDSGTGPLSALLQAGTNAPPVQASTHHDPSTQQSAPPQASIPGIDPQVQQLVRQQLEVLAGQGFIWQGEAWPGADLQCEIQRRQGQEDAGDHDFDETHWATQLKLKLLHLGTVSARLSLAGDQIVMRLSAPQSAAKLSTAIEPLRARLTAHGLQASQLSVVSDPVDRSADPVDGERHAGEPTAPGEPAFE